MSDPSKARHLLLVAIPAYGHTRPLCALAGRLAAHTNIVVTILVAPNWLHKAQSDISAQFSPGDTAPDCIRVVSLFDSTESELFKLVPMVMEHFPTAYETLLRGKAIRCASRGMTFPAAAPPCAVILDIFALPQLTAMRSLSGTQVPVFSFLSTHSAVLIRGFGPESLGGRGDFGARIDAEAFRVGKTAEEVGNQIMRHTDGTLVSVPGIPAMYDYEFYPQVPFKGQDAAFLRAAYDMIMACNGIFVGTTPAYDGESFFALEAWVRDALNKPVYGVGPLLPPKYGTQPMPLPSTPGDLEVKSFLDSMQLKHGNESVLFISFGTLLWPRQDQINELVNALIEKQFPFLLCHASPTAVVPVALCEKIKASGIGMTSSWAPQQFILAHPATSWFVTHCGHGGIIEALGSGVPMICWPFVGDGPIGAVHLSQNLNVAFHLMEVRAEKGLLPLRSGAVPVGTRAAMRAEFRQIIEECRGENGKEKRINAKRMRDDLASVWEAGGSSTRTIESFLRQYLVASPSI
ncbi:hypothetical protein K438DRAFT_1734557 [Mycena galopus ATCC 62051]|nr:hypothetical protein K438DRAFT_1734557 [Mycena galopus ATCC 62051]